MKTKKWLWITLITILTIVALVGVGFAGYRLGLTQNPAVIKQLAELRTQRFNQMQKQNNQAPNANIPQGKAPYQMWNGQNPRMQGFDQRGNFQRGFDPRFESGRGFDRGHRSGFFSPLFGLVHLVILGALLWFGYKFIKNSGWKLVKVSPAPTVEQAPKSEEPKNE